MIATAILLALVGSPAAEFSCPLKSQQRGATLALSPSPSWHVNFLGYSGSASQMSENGSGSLDRIQWRNAKGQEFLADITWSNSWGSTGVAATVKLKNKATGEAFEGACYPNGERA